MGLRELPLSTPYAKFPILPLFPFSFELLSPEGAFILIGHTHFSAHSGKPGALLATCMRSFGRMLGASFNARPTQAKVDRVRIELAQYREGPDTRQNPIRFPGDDS
jgi:hypothetical protein